jgi:hypothetical protein
MLGLGLPEFLQARVSPTGRFAGGPERSCIFIVQYGGCSHVDAFDPKPDAPAEIRGPYRPIATATPGIQVGELLPRLAKVTPHLCLVRSMSHRDSEHDGGMHVCMTGHSQPRENTPYFGSVAAKLRPSRRNVPSYVWVQNLDRDVQPRYLTGGFLGSAYAPLRVCHNTDNPSSASFRVTAFDAPADVPPSRLHHRQQLLAKLEEPAGAPLRAMQGRTMQRYQERALDLVTGPQARNAFDLGREPASLRDRYGRHPLGQNLLLARRLIEAGVRLVSVNAWLGFPEGDKFIFTQGWDFHGTPNQGSIFGSNQYGLGFALPRFDEAVSALIDDLHQRGLLRSTLVAIVGEFGRTPKILNHGFPGRDHWPHAYTALLAGAGVRGGTVYGASDKSGAYVRDNPVSPEAFGATLFQALGIPSETRLGHDGFTEPVSLGRPVAELLG